MIMNWEKKEYYLVISKSSLISLSRRSALSNATFTYFSFCCSGISGASWSRDVYKRQVYLLMKEYFPLLMLHICLTVVLRQFLLSSTDRSKHHLFRNYRLLLHLCARRRSICRVSILLGKSRKAVGSSRMMMRVCCAKALAIITF